MENNDYYEPTIKTARTTTSNTNYYQLDYANELTKLNIEKQQLISFLEDKIKEYKKTEKYLYEEENTKLVEKARVMGIIGAYQEVLDFVNKGEK